MTQAVAPGNAGAYILVFNAGSSSLKFELFAIVSGAPVSCLRGVVRALGEQAVCEWRVDGVRHELVAPAASYEAASCLVLDLLERGTAGHRSRLAGLRAIGHRVVHGGETFTATTPIDAAAIAGIEALSQLAPLHNPPAVAVMRSCRERLPEVPMLAAFDTAFFADLPASVRLYALPAAWRAGPPAIRRYGFHGLAHRSMREQYRSRLDPEDKASRLITLQLGQGCSIAAIAAGRPVEISMGFTPLEGLVMATRPGDVDAGVLLHLLQSGKVTLAELADGLSHRAGLLALSGTSGDMQTLLELEGKGHAGARLAIDAFCHRIRKYIGAYLVALGGADAIVFGGGIGEHAAVIRSRICAGMEWCGVIIDAAANSRAAGGVARISVPDARIAVHVVPVDEELLIAQDVVARLGLQ
jgi:acetate kinase